MGSTIQSLIGAKILNIEKKMYDYWHIGIDIGQINIYNPVKYCKTNNHYDFCNIQLEEILNHVIINVTYEELLFVQLELDNSCILTISLSEEDYTGPEALNLHLDNGEVIVI